MVIFHSYVKLPEGILHFSGVLNPGSDWLDCKTLVPWFFDPKTREAFDVAISLLRRSKQQSLCQMLPQISAVVIPIVGKVWIIYG